MTLDTCDPPANVEIFGYPEIEILQVDMRCPICTDIEEKIENAVSYWQNACPNDPKKSKFVEGFEILKKRTPLHSSRTFEDGASGGPITRLNGDKPVVTMMYQGGTPEFYYSRYRNSDHPMEHRIEYGISMKDVKDILDRNAEDVLRQAIFN